MQIVFFTLLYLVCNVKLYSQNSNLKFDNFDTSEGISSSTCIEIFQDSEGFMWFGTIDGLNRYDGYNFEVYRPVLNDENSLSNNRINSVTEDNMGVLWIGTSNGLNIFDKKQEKFYRLSLHNQSTNVVDQSEIINDVYYDEISNNIWIATKNGVFKFNSSEVKPPYEQNFKFSHYTNLKQDTLTLDNNDVTAIIKDKENKIWAITEGNNLNLYNSSKDVFERQLIDVPNTFELNHIPKVVMVDNDGDFWIGNNLSRLVFWDRNKNVFKEVSAVKANISIFHIYQDKKGLIWIATDGDGIYLFDKKKGLLKHIVHNQFNEFSLPNNQPSKILEDKEGVFWIATYNKGISKLVMSKSAFGHYFYGSDNKNGLSAKRAQAVLQDSEGRIWIGTDGGGLNLFHEKSNSYKYYKANPKDIHSLSSDKIVYLSESFDKSIWVCTWDGGLNKFDPKTGKVEQFKYNANNPYSIGQNTVWCTVEDDKNRLWLGTQSEGLNMFDPKTKRFYTYKNVKDEKHTLISNLVFSNFVDSKNRLLIGTSLGLCVVDLNKLDGYIPEKIEFIELKEKPIQGKRVNYIAEDTSGGIWIGTGVALHHLDENLKLIKSYSTLDGLPNNLVLGIKQSDKNNLWITTKGGLSKLDISKGEFYNYTVQDGVQGKEFQSKSIAKLKDGRILAGGINGFNLFNPEDIIEKATPLKPIITKFKLFNEVINAGDKVNDRVILEESISNTKFLELEYDEGYLSFKFVAFHYQNPNSVQYVYRMKGLHDDFIKAGVNREANYSSLPPGDYEFQVKASVNGNFEEADITSIRVSVLSPPWQTWWAYIVYVLLFFGVFRIGVHYYTKFIKEEKDRELDQLKLRFFINVSHELRTPLTLILNPVDKILSAFNNPEVVKESALTLQRSSRRLLFLVNQLLDFRKMDLHKTPLNLVKSDYVFFTKDILDLFNDLAKTKKIKLEYQSSEELLPAVFDVDNIEKIITNLLSNAVKFTGVGGVVKLTLSKVVHTNKKYTKADFVKIEIKDTGIGFKPEQLKNVFGRFVNPGDTKVGMGIGLNITKGLVELHDGEIEVQSKFKQGTTFTILLPLIPKMAKDQNIEESTNNEKEYDSNVIKSTEYEIAISSGENEVDISSSLEVSQAQKPLILIVEDNNELRKHLKNELKNSYRVIEAVNGVDGMEKINKHYPDIVISDIMMPEMDGFEFCRQVKSNIDVCHIPIILLTARNLDEDRIVGYQTGADAYIPKPYKTSVLKARVKNLLETKKRLRDKFSALTGLLPSSEVTSNSLDEAFLDKTTKAVLENIDDIDFKLEDLITTIGVGRSWFYRKINALTNQTPSNFIRTIRLKYAAELLINNSYSIKEVSHMSGFNSTAYFSKTFKDLYGLTPTEYVDTHKIN
ncbi:hybrid sensor histidine kinase/response regulator transcription factor [Wenyingzhuangia sp. IMCC45467]